MAEKENKKSRSPSLGARMEIKFYTMMDMLSHLLGQMVKKNKTQPHTTPSSESNGSRQNGGRNGGLGEQTTTIGSITRPLHLSFTQRDSIP